MVVRQGIMVEGIGGAKLLTSWQPESRERKRPGIDKGTNLVTNFFQSGSTFQFPSPPNSSFN
jgi:hypothetical protein